MKCQACESERFRVYSRSVVVQGWSAPDNWDVSAPCDDEDWVEEVLCDECHAPVPEEDWPDLPGFCRPPLRGHREGGYWRWEWPEK